MKRTSVLTPAKLEAIATKYGTKLIAKLRNNDEVGVVKQFAEQIQENRQPVTPEGGVTNLQQVQRQILETSSSFIELTGVPFTPSMIVLFLENFDPTPNRENLDWIVRQYIAGKFRLEDQTRVTNTLIWFSQMKLHRQLEAAERDINKYDFVTLQDLQDEYNKDSAVVGELVIDTTDVEVLYTGPLGFVGIPLNVKASENLGRDTRWCTAMPNSTNYKSYADQSPLYVYISPTGEKFQFHSMSQQYMDRRDSEISTEQLHTFRDTFPTSLIFQRMLEEVMRLGQDDLPKILRHIRKCYGKRVPEVEEMIKSDRFLCAAYAEAIIKGRWDEMDEFIAEDFTLYLAYLRRNHKTPEGFKQHVVRYLDNPIYLSVFIEHMSGQREPEYEHILLKDPEAAANYAITCIKGRWPEAEPIIATHAASSVAYALQCINGRWKDGEAAIMTDHDAATLYCIQVMKSQRWPEAEPIIRTCPLMGATYAVQVLKGRWPEAEDVIKTVGFCALMYARHVLNARWEAAEDAIAQSPDDATFYSEFLIPETEPTPKVILDSILSRPEHSVVYAVRVHKKRAKTLKMDERFIAGEEIISTNPHTACMYAQEILKRKWPEAEEVIKTDNEAWSRYERAFN